MATSIKQVLIGGKRMEAIKKIQEEQRKKSGIEVASAPYEIARGLIDRTLAGYM